MHIARYYTKPLLPAATTTGLYKMRGYWENRAAPMAIYGDVLNLQLPNARLCRGQRGEGDQIS